MQSNFIKTYKTITTLLVTFYIFQTRMNDMLPDDILKLITNHDSLLDNIAYTIVPRPRSSYIMKLINLYKKGMFLVRSIVVRFVTFKLNHHRHHHQHHHVY